MSTIMNINVEAARFDPASVFERPMDVVSELGLTRGQKLETLQRWANSLQDQLKAASEGMLAPPGMSSESAGTLEEIGRAVGILQEAEDGT